MTTEQSLMLLSGLKKISNRMDELKSIGIEFKDMGKYEVSMTMEESAILAQFAGIGLEAYEKLAPVIELNEFAKRNFGIDLIN